MDISRVETPLETGRDSRTGILEEVSIEEARRQLRFLAESMDALRNTADARVLLDEAYRAAHVVKGELDQAGMPDVARIARLVQEVVRAVRAGRISAGAELGSLLSSAARRALDSLEAHVTGSPDSGASESAGVELEYLLARPPRFRPAEEPGAEGTLVLTRVDARRLQTALDASSESGAAAASVARAAEESVALLEGLRTLAGQQEHGTRELLDAIPSALAAAARGQPTTGIAGGLSGRVAALGKIASEFEESFSRFAARLREAAQKGERASAAAGEATSRIGSVLLATLFDGFPRLVLRRARKLPLPVEVVVDTRALEIDASMAEIVRTAINRSALASLNPDGKRPRNAGRKAARASLRHSSASRRCRLSLQARADAGEGLILVQLLYEGRVSSKAELERALEGIRTRLQRKKIPFQIELKKRGRAVFSLRLPQPLTQGMLSGSFMLGRAGDILYAISADAVEEAIVVPPSGSDFMWKGEKLLVTSMGGSKSPHAGVVVSVGGQRAVLLFEQLEGEERLYSTSIEYTQTRPPGIVAAAARADGSVALIIDVLSYLPVKSTTGKPGAARARKRSH